MKIIDENGLRVALVSAQEASSGTIPEAIDIVRLANWQSIEPSDLKDMGFIVKPDWITWLSPMPASREAFLQSLARKSRHNVVKALRDMEGALEVDVIYGPKSHDIFDFEKLYTQALQKMENPVDALKNNRDKIIASPENYFMVKASLGEQIHGACLLHWCPNNETVRLRYAAVSAEWRNKSLSRALYEKAMEVGRRLGARWMTLGNDPNLYGHIVQFGLLRFKSSLGFAPVPAYDFYNDWAACIAERYLRLQNTSDPAGVIEYVDGRPSGQLGLVILSKSDQEESYPLPRGITTLRSIVF